NNVKLGRGGIREIEFIVQTLQLVRGGMNPDMRERELMPSLSKLIRPDCLTREESATLLEAYEFLRRFENRLQAISDRQTHDVPADDLNRARLCLAMDANDWESLAEELAGYRDLVANQFRHTLFVSEAPEEEAESDAVSQAFSAGVSDDQFIDVLNDLGFADSDAALERLNSFRESGFYLRLDESGRQRLNTLMPAVVSAAAHEPDALTALTGMLTIIEAIGRRSAYFALLSENPGALKRLVNLCAMSKLFVTRVAAHPLLLDELIDPRVFSVPPTREDFAEDLDERLAAATLHDAEASRFALRDFQQAATFRVAVTDLSGMLPLMKVSDRLTDVAELVLDGALRLARHEMFAKYGRPMCTVDGETREARFAIVAYGKLGGLELGYGSDLDLVFLHDSEGGDQFTDRDKPIDNNVFFARFAQRIIHILTMSTSTGPLYEVDMRLRPNGKAGLLVTSLQAFHRYQQKEAWTWEHQALLRGRSVAGDAELISAFEAVRQSVLSQNINYDTLKKDVADMREKMRGQLDKSTDALFDLKQGVGGITDIEFTVQYLVLAEAHNAPELTEFSDNIRQLEALAAAKIMPAEEAGFLTDAYREYRSQLHLQSLADQPRLVDRAQTAELAGKVHAVWQRVFA
ncbi:MAG: bifunctional [glutamate--ammonia ligase]-adenylyl-L-tyrosine phosphorylase/[glutamate--ammonia-ligase] adenylyltransferase, partial [Gammaproteobacteria bacterium]|nr:bifunctional [glutamate--ammonia ligase]-adenylyl-L-tyrosine phosphorylase/[glutamate--ammonia-ligase] adenylyltransferase [Gammaproteobacteria bacterium]